MKLIVSLRLMPVLAVLCVLLIYFQSIGHPFSRFDDPFIVDFYGLNNPHTFREIITPGGSFYYRPLVNLSYWFDFSLWELDPRFMHLDNIIAHLLNVFLVYLIASRLPASSDATYLPLFCALLFGLHPINTESVNWIAGRTDVFAGMFVFLAFYFLIRSIQEQSTRFAMFAFAVAFAGTLAKETAVMFIPAAFLAITRWPAVTRDDVSHATWRMRLLVVAMIVSSGLALLVLLVHIKGHGNTAVSLVFEGGADILVRSLEAFGFYVRKFFLPLPLNAAIVQVDPGYAVVGIIALTVIVLTCRRSAIPWIFLASAVLFTLPSLIVATSSFAWTPFGERYLYIPSAFAVVGCLDLTRQYLIRWNKGTWFAPLFAIIITIAAVITYQRSRLWGDNFELVRDTVAKSPHFGVVLNEFGVLLKQAGRLDEADKQFRTAAEQKNKANVARVIQLNLVGMKLLGKKPDEARGILLKEIGDKSTGDVELLKLVNRYSEGMYYEAASPEGRKQLVTEIVETNEILYRKTHDPFYLYRSGQLTLSVGNIRDAKEFFRRTWEKAPADAYYRESARRLSEKLISK